MKRKSKANLKIKKAHVPIAIRFELICIGLVLVIAACNNGSFEGYGLHDPRSYRFESPILYTGVIAAIILGGAAVHVLNIKSRLEINLVAGTSALLLPLAYLISLNNAASPYMAGYGVLVSVMMLAFYSAGSRIQLLPDVLRLIPVIYLVIGYLVVVYGYFNLLGNVYLLDSLSMVDGIRIASIFQYPNAYALFLLTLWIAILLELDRAVGRFWVLLHGCMLIFVTLSFLLTLSRGAIVILPVIAILVMALLNLRQQLMAILYTVVGVLLSLTIYNPVSERGTAVYEGYQRDIANGVNVHTVSVFAQSSIKYWGMLIGLSLAAAGVIYLVRLNMEPIIASFAGKRRSNWANSAIPGASIIFFALGALIATHSSWLPTALETRIANINFQTHSVYERLTMYKDALHIWKLHPIFGGGAGAWEAYFERYQSYPYISMQPHSYFVQLLVETGIIGLIAIVAFIIAIIATYYRSYRKSQEEQRSLLRFYFIVPVAVLLHSTIDFGMSYLLFGFVVFFCLGVLSRPGDSWVAARLSDGALRIGRIMLAGGFSIFAIALMVVSIKWLYASEKFHAYTQAVAEEKSYPEMMSLLEGSLKHHAGHPIMLNQAAALNYQMYNQTQESAYLDKAEACVDRMLNREPHSPPGMYFKYLLARAKGDDVSALAIILDCITSNPFEEDYYEQAIALLVQQKKNERQNGKQNERSNRQIIELYNRMIDRVERIEKLPDTVMPARMIAAPVTVRAAAGQAYYEQADYAEAEKVLQPIVGGEAENLADENIRYAVRYYIAALRKQGKDDTALYENLIRAHAAENQEIEKLM
ncbi:O-antigen ligase family protein [Cohnella sp. 56]|uniref:O-antigen ligase family protein n=1 Tax=Cohnella sp. 56 TaxID=3113722 RepID=UPI0030E7746A